ncbi:hypothetical protein AAFF_G00067200 [Aldrovandia affinis]|uniref:RING-type domain-containing protein n=1 Tax=Aldrovandia affinis TaxID=143900 RepID=A0AAD7T487_9TELE|nr:hypothetical protein AAFF_G00067200 [Aldrovandia affinis]
MTGSNRQAERASPWSQTKASSPRPRPEEGAPDLECAICFSPFNNVFRTPKMLKCRHTFCLECLARMNVKSAEPNAIQCPLCRGVTALPVLGLPKLDNDPAILSYLPEAMQRVYSVRFNRSKGRLQVRRPLDAQRAPSTVSHSLDVGMPAHHSATAIRGPAGPRGVLRIVSRPTCQAVMMVGGSLVLATLICVIIFLLRSQ